MRYLQLILLLLLFTNLSAQLSNDECEGLIDLGIAPICNETIYTNINATASNTGGIPSCFLGRQGVVQRDIWFKFTTSAEIETYTITIEGVVDGINEQALQNPQLTFYRGSCENLSELGCVSAENGAGSVQFTISNLPANQQFTFRLNDYTASVFPNSGDFILCIEERVEFTLGEGSFTNRCRGTLFDSGGENRDYSADEDLTFTICPDEQHDCIYFDFEELNIERNFDYMTIYAGSDIDSPITARFTGSTAFPIQVNSNCATIRFQSDGTAFRDGFELNWRCITLCSPTSLDNVMQIPSDLPFTASLSTCEVVASFAETDCGSPLFLNGAEHILHYNSSGNECISINLEGAPENTGIAVLDGLPNNENSSCIGFIADSYLPTVKLEEAGDYYIIIANQNGCINFYVELDKADCPASTSLRDALCNPINICTGENMEDKNIVTFQNIIGDITFEEGINSGCWQIIDAEPLGVSWFVIEAQADGKFGFIVEDANEVIDMDFNVWGPFVSDDICEERESIVSFIEQNQPIRSSWASPAGATGLTSTHPVFRYPINDRFDCISPNNPGASGDSFVQPIDAEVGEYYVVLLSNFSRGDNFNRVNLDWTPSDLAVLTPPSTVNINIDTTICEGSTLSIGETTVSTSGTYIISLSSSSTCDTIVQLNLNLLNAGEPCEDGDLNTFNDIVTEDCICAGTPCSQAYSNNIESIIESLSDTIRICKGDTVQLSNLENNGLNYYWSGGDIEERNILNVSVSPERRTVYDLQVFSSDSLCRYNSKVNVLVDSLPPNLDIMPSDTTNCGNYVVLTSEAYEPSLYFYIQHQWFPLTGQQTPDSLYNIVVLPQLTGITRYKRITTNGVCVDTSFATITIEALPEIQISSDRNVICEGKRVRLNVDLLNPDEATIIDYRWSPGNLTIPSNQATTIVTTGNTEYTVDVRTEYGCPGRASIYLEEGSSLFNQVDTVLCNGENLLFKDRIITEEGFYEATFIAIDGCDSIVEIDVKFEDIKINVVPIPTCDESIPVGIDTLGILTSIGGCDSLLLGDIFYVEGGRAIIQETICEGEYVELNGSIYDSPGVYDDVFPTTYSCDSLVTIVVSLRTPIYTTMEAQFCTGESHYFAGQYLTREGLYKDTLRSESGCDSLITFLDLNEVNISNFQAIQDEVVMINSSRSINIYPLENDVLAADETYILELLDAAMHGSAGVNGKELNYQLSDLSFIGDEVLRYIVCAEACPSSCDTASVYIQIYPDCLEGIEERLPSGIIQDAMNDNACFDPLAELKPFCTAPILEAELMIINTNSQIVFVTRPYQAWCGKDSKGNNLPAGTYYYVFRFGLGEEEVVLKHWIVLFNEG